MNRNLYNVMRTILVLTIVISAYVVVSFLLDSFNFKVLLVLVPIAILQFVVSAWWSNRKEKRKEKSSYDREVEENNHEEVS